MAAAIAAARMPYSIAVTPLSSRRKERSFAFIFFMGRLSNPQAKKSWPTQKFGGRHDDNKINNETYYQASQAVEH
ncbi:hypothetical protein SOASR015_19640 [Pectobacterium carotovorum subsp. carotovorum]|nr:hypothetical protein SOASR015_19640 [Pectobacterium carotovorum subsp. carotovorum]GLX55794.1 hypothetical protein Pcaca02_11030 [Pectobacterium carotovorum subsp. carotovorum]